MATAAPSPAASPTANKAELLAIADAVAREKLIDKGIVIEAMEDAIQRAARARYGAENACACGACSKWSRSRKIISSRST
jgi:transcription termination/antitermination protein NusA